MGAAGRTRSGAERRARTTSIATLPTEQARPVRSRSASKHGGSRNEVRSKPALLGDTPKPTAPTPGTPTSEAGERVEGNGGGCCYVQRIDPVRHRDGDHHIGRCQGRIRQARPLCTEEQGHTDGVT